MASQNHNEVVSQERSWLSVWRVVERGLVHRPRCSPGAAHTLAWPRQPPLGVPAQQEMRWRCRERPSAACGGRLDSPTSAPLLAPSVGPDLFCARCRRWRQRPTKAPLARTRWRSPGARAAARNVTLMLFHECGRICTPSTAIGEETTTARSARMRAACPDFAQAPIDVESLPYDTEIFAGGGGVVAGGTRMLRPLLEAYDVDRRPLGSRSMLTAGRELSFRACAKCCEMMLSGTQLNACRGA